MTPPKPVSKKARDKNQWTILRKQQYEFLKRRLPLAGKALDVGAGPQQFLELTKRFDLTAIDIQLFEGIDQVVDLEKGLPFADNLFDVVISTNTFEHIHNVDRLVQESFRVLKTGGVLVGSTPFFLSLHQEPYDFWRFTIYELEKMFKEVGFRDLKIEPLGTARDAYYQASYHFFVKLYDAKRYYLIVKILWNMQKLIFWLFNWLYRTNASQRSPLGYGFYAKK